MANSAEEARAETEAFLRFANGVSYAGNIRPKIAPDDPNDIPGDERDDDETSSSSDNPHTSDHGWITLLPVDTDSIAAFHEAAHAVVAYAVGLYVSPAKGVWIDGAKGRVHTLRRDWDKEEDASVMVSLAGSLAEWKFEGVPDKRMTQFPDDIASCIATARGENDNKPCDARKAFKAILTTRGDHISDVELVTAFEEYEVLTARLINRPLIWRAIEKVSRALLKTGKLSAAEIEDILVLYGRRRLLSEWCGVFDGE